ncbi:MAG: peroxiredoxin family protein [Planctomycetota bacterium]
MNAAREAARLDPRPGTVDAFVKLARGYVATYPHGQRTSDIHLWLGDFLRFGNPREAYRAYRRSLHREARERADQIAFRAEAPPKLEVDRWVGKPMEADGCPDKVKTLVFFSERHPQSRRFLPWAIRMHERHNRRGLRLIGVAAVVDAHGRQRPDQLEKRIKAMGLPFPVAIDKQQWGQHSLSLRRYRGRYVPWAVCIDRYGRIRWAGGFSLQPNAMTHMEQRITQLLDEPTYEQIENDVRAGKRPALDRLARIRTRDTTVCLARVLDTTRIDTDMREAARRVLGELMPRGHPRDDASLKAWANEHKKFRYSFADDRLVPR